MVLHPSEVYHARSVLLLSGFLFIYISPLLEDFCCRTPQWCLELAGVSVLPDTSSITHPSAAARGLQGGNSSFQLWLWPKAILYAGRRG